MGRSELVVKGGAAQVKLPKWARVLFEPQFRYISLRGGRGSGKTKNVARSLVIRCSQKKLRILCTREVQGSIKESVYEQLKSEIAELNLSDQFDILRDEIRHLLTGSVFIFKGLNDLSVGAIKSMANIDVCWIEEAQFLTAQSWEKLDPTIRADGSQIILTWNPELETDFIYELVVTKTLPNCANLFINHDANPWFPKELQVQEQTMAAHDPVKHRHVWLGMPLPAVSGAIYFDDIARIETEGRIRNMTVDPLLGIYIFMDLGFNDHTACGVKQRGHGESRYVDFIENNRVKLEWFSDAFKERGYEGATIVMPHDGRAKALQTGLSPAELMESYGWNVEICPNVGIEEGIRLAREQFHQAFFDQTRCAGLIQHLKRYARNKQGHPIHDEHSHAADMFRYAEVYTNQMSNSLQGGWRTDGAPLQYRTLRRGG